MSFDCRKFPRHPVAADHFEMRGRSTINLYYYYRVNPKLSKGVCAIFRIPFSYPDFSDQLDKCCLTNWSPSSQPSCAFYEKYYYNKIIENWIIMEFLCSNTSQI